MKIYVYFCKKKKIVSYNSYELTFLKRCLFIEFFAKIVSRLRCLQDQLGKIVNRDHIFNLVLEDRFYLLKRNYKMVSVWFQHFEFSLFFWSNSNIIYFLWLKIVLFVIFLFNAVLSTYFLILFKEWKSPWAKYTMASGT